MSAQALMRVVGYLLVVVPPLLVRAEPCAMKSIASNLAAGKVCGDRLVQLANLTLAIKIGRCEFFIPTNIGGAWHFAIHVHMYAHTNEVNPSRVTSDRKS